MATNLSPEDRAALHKMQRILSLVADVSPYTSVLTLQIFIEVALHDINEADNYILTELAKAVRTTQPTMTRTIRALENGDHKYGPRDGMKLLESYSDVKDPRRKKVTVGAGGKNLLRKLLSTLTAKGNEDAS